MPLFGVKLCIERQLGHADNAVHRRTNLMTHVGHKVTARPIGSFSVFLGGQGFGFRLPEAGNITMQNQQTKRPTEFIASSHRALEEKPLPCSRLGL